MSKIFTYFYVLVLQYILADSYFRNLQMGKPSDQKPPQNNQNGYPQKGNEFPQGQQGNPFPPPDKNQPWNQFENSQLLPHLNDSDWNQFENPLNGQLNSSEFAKQVQIEIVKQQLLKVVDKFMDEADTTEQDKKLAHETVNDFINKAQLFLSQLDNSTKAKTTDLIINLIPFWKNMTKGQKKTVQKDFKHFNNLSEVKKQQVSDQMFQNLINLTNSNPNDMPTELLSKIGSSFHNIIENERKNPNQQFNQGPVQQWMNETNSGKEFDLNKFLMDSNTETKFREWIQKYNQSNKADYEKINKTIEQYFGSYHQNLTSDQIEQIKQSFQIFATSVNDTLQRNNQTSENKTLQSNEKQMEESTQTSSVISSGMMAFIFVIVFITLVWIGQKLWNRRKLVQHMTAVQISQKYPQQDELSNQ